ncbi:hypothetical protein RDABS01_015286 [Bienertia sinuspersici]
MKMVVIETRRKLGSFQMCTLHLLWS